MLFKNCNVIEILNCKEEIIVPPLPHGIDYYQFVLSGITATKFFVRFRAIYE